MGQFNMFFDTLLQGFSFNETGWIFHYTITFLILLGIYFRINKKNLLTKKVLNITFIFGLLGTGYTLTLLGNAAYSQAIPNDILMRYVFTGFAHAIQPLVLTFFGWLILSILDIFMKQEK
jgi:hypothetical protein